MVPTPPPTESAAMSERAKVLEMPPGPETDNPADRPLPARAARIARSWTLVPSSLGEAMEIAKLIADSDFAPKDYKGKPANVLIAIQMGADVGLAPLQSLQNIAVINGRPAIWGDAALALVQSSGVLERFHECFEGTPGQDGYAAVCIAKRKGFPDEVRRTFSVADAKLAKLWAKTGRDGQPTPWVTYPYRMLQMRARGFTLRDVAPDRLMGLILCEEAMDLPQDVGPVVYQVGVGSPAPSIFERVPEALRDTVEKAFETLNLAPGLRIAKLNEFLGGEGVDPEVGATALLEWCRDEYAKRKTGEPRKAKPKPDANGKAVKAETLPKPEPTPTPTPEPLPPPEPPPTVPPPPIMATADPTAGDLF